MSKDKNSRNPPSYRDLQRKIETSRVKRDNLNKKTKDYINRLQEIENEISEDLRVAKDVYRKKRDYWNTKVKKLKDKKIEYKKLMDGLFEEKKVLQKKKGEQSSKNRFLAIKQIERKIENLERQIETENFEITEENAIIDKIKELAGQKQDILSEHLSDDLYKIERKIEIVKINLNKIYEQLEKWSNKSQENHNKMHELYDKVSELKKQKKILEEELIENKKAADRYHEQFLDHMNQMKKNYRGQRFRSPYPKKKHERKDKRKEHKRKLEKIKQEKLAEALEKQKAGKKLNIYEVRLILEKSKG